MERQAVAKTQKSAARSNPLQTQATRPTSAAHPMMELQRSIGNQAVQRLIRSPYIQTKLQVGTRRDRFGPETSHTAEKVMRSPAGPSGGGPIIQRKCACDGEEECAGCQERKLVQRQALGGAEQTSLPASVREVMQSGGGAALPKATQDHMESALGADLGGVRVHTDSQADRAAQDIKAEAFTVGQNIYFGAGRYQPTTTGGQRLLAHELTHTMQQWNGPVAAARAGLSVSQPSEPQELEAEAVANRVVSGDFVNRTAMQSSSAARQIQRYSWDEFVGDVENVGKAVSEGAETVSQAVGGGAEAVGEAVQEGAAAVGGRVAAGVEAVEEATSWVLTEAGQLAVSAATELAGMLGGKVTIVGTGIMISIPDVELCKPRSIPVLTLPMASVHIPLWGWAGVFGPIGVGAAAGIRLGVQPSLAVSYGPCRLQKIGLILDPIKHTYAGTAQLYIAGAVTGTATLEGALKAIGVIGLFTPPIALMVGVEGGLRGTLRGIGAGALEETVTVGYIGGAWALNLDSALMIGASLELDLDFFANAQLYNFVVCEYVLPLASWVLASTAERYELPISVTSGGVTVGPVTQKPIPFSDIEVLINRTRPQTRCLSLDQIIEELCKRKLLPPSLCPTPGGPGPVGPSVTPARPTFNVKAFSAGGSGNARLTENTTTLKVTSPTYSSSTQVEVNGGDAADYEIGYIQTMYTNTIESEYEKTFERWEIASLPIRDGFSKSNVPWYSSKTAVPADGATVSESMSDAPDHSANWDDPRIANPNTLMKTTRENTFVAWLIARHRTTGDIVYLRNISWGIDFLVNVDKTKPVGSRASNAGTGMRSPSTGNGKGGSNPNLNAPIANDAYKRKLVSK
jgi:uncharacterized protein DUF4157